MCDPDEIAARVYARLRQAEAQREPVIPSALSVQSTADADVVAAYLYARLGTWMP